MPNWCANHVTFKNVNAEEIKRLEDAFNSNKLFETFVAMPEELQDTTSPSDKSNQDLITKYGTDNWYNWNVENWGTKWDANCEDGGIIGQSETEITVGFDTAWSPPLAFYAKMEELGWEIRAAYFEPGMMFCGIYANGDDEYYEIGEDEIPDELEDLFDISSWIDEEE